MLTDAERLIAARAALAYPPGNGDRWKAGAHPSPDLAVAVGRGEHDVQPREETPTLRDFCRWVERLLRALRDTWEAAGYASDAEYLDDLDRSPCTVAARLLRPLGLTVEELEREKP